MTMKKTVFLGMVVLMACIGSGKVYAQTADNGNDQAARRREIQERRVERMAKALELKDDAKEMFTKTYGAYLQELATAMPDEVSDSNPKTAETGKKEKALTDAEATQRIKEQFDRQEQRIARMQRHLEVQTKYYAEFSKFLSPQQVMKIFMQQRQGGVRNAGSGRGDGTRRMQPGRPRGGGFGNGFDGAGSGFGDMD